MCPPPFFVPAWSRNGRELYYRSASHMMAAAIQTEPSLSVGTREELFEDTYIVIPNRTNFDISPQDGRVAHVPRRA